ncbi:MAG: AhpC/TSA family protein [Dysgonamonadaceae bacterium]|jgi:peroxiredoxin|nr:AhpC/TSA family protein [Dysgonamonadaceae bacterium]
MKQILYITLIMLFFFSCTGKESYVIEGKITGLQNASLYIVVSNAGEGVMSVDTVQAEADGKFLYSGSSGQQVPVVLYMEEGNVWTTVWARNRDKISIAGDVKYPELIIAGGSEVNDLLANFKTENKSLLKEKRKLTDQYSSDIEESDSLDTKLNYSDYESKILNVDHQLRDKAEKFISDHPASIASLVLIQDYLMDENDPKQTQTYLSKITGDITQNELYKKLVRVNDKLLLTEPGAKAPDFMVLGTSKDSIQLDSYSGKYFLLTFAASWCETCDKDNEDLVALHKEINKDKLEMLTISLDQDSAAWRSVVKDKKMVWEQVVDTDGWSSDMVSLYNITKIPSNILINRESIIVGRNLSTDSIKKVVTIL